MSHCLDPHGLRTYSEYEDALRELEELLLSDPDTPAGRRFDDLVALVEDYDARHGNVVPASSHRDAA